MLSAETARRLPYAARLRRARIRARLRYERRVGRSLHIGERFRAFYGKAPHVSSQLWIHDAWTGRRQRWSYEGSVHLEDEAWLLWQRLERLRRTR